MFTKMTMTLFLSTTIISSSTPMSLSQIKRLSEQDKQINDTLITHSDDLGDLYKTPRTLNTEKEFRKAIDDFHKKEQERRRQEEEEAKRREKEKMKKLKLEKERQVQNQSSTPSSNNYDIDFVITHYGRGSDENGGYAGITCTGKPLREGMVASNYYKLGTVIEFEDGSRVIVSDRGGSNFNSPTRLDKFVDTTNQAYLNALGKKKLKGRIVQ